MRSINCSVGVPEKWTSKDGCALLKSTAHNFPVSLQQRFESLLFSGALPVRSILRIDKLAQELNASAEDMRVVLSSAYRKGLVDHCADGACVVLAPAKPAIESVFQHTARLGFKPTTIVRAVELISAEADIARKLDVKIGEPVYMQVRSRLVEGRMLANQHNYLPVEVCPGLEKVDLSQRSFQETLEQDFHAVVAEVEESARLEKASLEDIVQLGLEQGENVVVVNRLSLSATRQPLVWADIHVRADRMDYLAALWPNAAALLKN